MKPAIQLYAYQQRWFRDRARFKCAMFARQTGKTFTTTLELVDSCMQAAANGTRERWVILSRGERQAKEAMDEGVKRHAQAYSAALQVLDSDQRIGESVYRVLEVSLPNDSRIMALPANPDTARGFSANVLLDEFAFHTDSRLIWRALFPVISNGYRLRVTSTPNGKGNKFYELMTKDDPQFPWVRHSCDIYQAVADGLPRNIEEMRAALDDEDAWAQEFELKWLDEASAWLSLDLINAVEHDQAGDPALYQGGPVFVGVDIGRRRDLFVIWVMEQIGDVLWTRQIITLKRGTFAEQDELLDGVFTYYNVVRVCMDQTGMGEKPVEDAQRRYGSTRVEGVLFNPTTKLTLATIGKQRFEARTLRIPMGDTALRADLHKLKKESGPTGTPRFVAEADAAGHADRAWACFLACSAASTNPLQIGFEAVSSRIGGIDRGVQRSSKNFMRAPTDEDTRQPERSHLL